MLAAAVSTAPAASTSLNISMGFLFDAAGTDPANRLPADTLFMLVADVGGDGFDPVPANSWVGGTDVALLVYDTEFTSASGGTRGFDLSSGASENGMFSRSLQLDPAQLGGTGGTVTLALRWFPGLKGDGGLPGSGPGTGVAYGQFSRSISLYGYDSWTVNLAPGASYTLDPFATSEFLGTDPASAGMANFLTVPVPEPSAAALLLLSPVSVLGIRRRFR